MTVLDQIVERTRARLKDEPKPDRRAAEAIAEGRTPFAFREALSRDAVNVRSTSDTLIVGTRIA